MNKRIEKLAKKAGFGLHRDGEIYTSRLEHLPITEDIEKFAKLIAQDILSYTKDGDLDFMKFMIKKHFGVEE